MNNQLVVCDICSHELGIVDLDTISTPMLPEMFKSIDEKHEIAPPFQDWMEWNQFVCRQCKFRPFHKENEITIQDDKYFKTVINIDKSELFKCSCGKEFQHKSSLDRHQKACNG